MVLFCTKILVLICFKNVNGVFMNDALKKKTPIWIPETYSTQLQIIQ